MTSATEVILTTCPRDCYDACGIAVIKRNGVISRVRGDGNNPVNKGSLFGKCAIAYNCVIRNPVQRLKTPLKRVGPKGLGQFQPISWASSNILSSIGLGRDRWKWEIST